MMSTNTAEEATKNLQLLLKQDNFSHDEIMAFAHSQADINVTDEEGHSLIVKLALLNADKFNETIYQLINLHHAKTILSTTASSIDSSQIEFSIKLAAGTYGTVFLGQWNNNDVAIKTFPFRENDIAKQLKHYCLEVEILSLLTDIPNIIGLKGHDSANHYIVLEYAESGSLEDIIKFQPSDCMNWPTRYDMLKGVLTGLDHLHKRDILHRDLKSANILIDKQNLPKIGDFGSASKKKVRYRDEVGALICRAPEAFHHPFYSERSDVYSFSRIIIETAFWKIMADILPPDIVNKTDLYDHLKIAVQMPKESPQKFTLFANWTSNFSLYNRPYADELLEEMQSDINTISENLHKACQPGKK